MSAESAFTVFRFVVAVLIVGLLLFVVHATGGFAGLDVMEWLGVGT